MRRGVVSARLAGALLGLTVATSLAGVANAQSGFSLSWSAPPNCPQQQEVRDRVRDLAASAYPGSPDLHARGEIRQLGDGYVLELEITEAGQPKQLRRIDAKACTDLAGAAAVIVGLALQKAARTEDTAPDAALEPSATPEGTTEPSTATTTAEVGPSETGETPTPPTTARTNPPGRAESPAPPPPTRSDASGTGVWIGLPHAGASAGALSKPAFLVGGALGIRTGTWSFALAGRHELPRTVEAVDAESIGVRVGSYAGELVVARTWRSGSLELAPGIAVGLLYLEMRGTGQNLIPSAGSARVVQFGADVVLRWFPFESIALATTISARAHATRPRFAVDALGDVGRLGLGQLAIALGPEWIF